MAEIDIQKVPTSDEQKGEPESEPLILGKYKTQDDLRNGINELIESVGAEKAYQSLSGAQHEPKSQAPPEMAIKVNPLGDDAGIDELLSKAGLNGAEVIEQYSQNGDLSDQQYENLQRTYAMPRGVIREVVGLRATAVENATRNIQSALYDLAGGDQQYRNLTAWASQNYNDNQQENFNASVTGPRATVDSAETAFKSLMFDHRSGIGARAETPMVQATGVAPRTNGHAFSSMQEMLTAKSEATKSHGNAYASPDYNARLEATRQTNPHVLRGANA